MRLENIPLTNALLSKLRLILADWPKDKRITGEVREEVLRCVREADKEGYVDYVTVSSSLLFSMNYVTDFEAFSATTFYNVVKQHDYDATDYLKGVERVHMDYKELFELYKNCQNVIFLVDPPYLNTKTSTYKSDGYWKLSDYLDVLQVLVSNKYIYFTSNKSSIIELCEWIGNRTVTANPFFGAETRTVNVTMNYNSTYTDIMLFK